MYSHWYDKSTVSSIQLSKLWEKGKTKWKIVLSLSVIFRLTQTFRMMKTSRLTFMFTLMDLVTTQEEHSICRRMNFTKFPSKWTLISSTRVLKLRIPTYPCLEVCTCVRWRWKVSEAIFLVIQCTRICSNYSIDH